MLENKIIHVLNEVKYSGAEFMLLDLADTKRFKRLDFSVVAVGKVKGEFYDEFNKKIQTRYIKYKSTIKLCPDITTVREFFNYIRSEKPHVVHLHQERANFSLAIICKMAGVNKIIRHVHHIFPVKPGIFGYIYKTVRLIQRRLLRTIGVYFISNSNSGFQNECITYQNRPHQIIPNWINTKRLLTKYNQTNAYDFPKHATVLLSTGGSWGYKNQELIIKSLAYLPDHVHYIRVGTNTEGDKYLELAKKLKVNNRFHDMGMVDDITPFLKRADIFVMPSTIEGFGNAALEALIVGKPCVLSDRPALNEFKKYFAAQVNLTSLNPVSISDNVKNFLTKIEGNQLNICIQEKVIQKFDVETAAGKLEKIYNVKGLP